MRGYLFRPAKFISTFCRYKTKTWNPGNFLILSFPGTYWCTKRNKDIVMKWAASLGAGMRGIHDKIGAWELRLRSKARNARRCSLCGSPLLGYPFVWHGKHTPCSLVAVPDGRKGRKTHAETIHTVDITADGTRAYRGVFCNVANDG